MEEEDCQGAYSHSERGQYILLGTPHRSGTEIRECQQSHPHFRRNGPNNPNRPVIHPPRPHNLVLDRQMAVPAPFRLQAQTQQQILQIDNASAVTIPAVHVVLQPRNNVHPGRIEQQQRVLHRQVHLPQQPE